jgi:hypothetical protein
MVYMGVKVMAYSGIYDDGVCEYGNEWRQMDVERRLDGRWTGAEQRSNES